MHIPEQDWAEPLTYSNCVKGSVQVVLTSQEDETPPAVRRVVPMPFCACKSRLPACTGSASSRRLRLAPPPKV